MLTKIKPFKLCRLHFATSTVWVALNMARFTLSESQAWYIAANWSLNPLIPVSNNLSDSSTINHCTLRNYKILIVTLRFILYPPFVYNQKSFKIQVINDIRKFYQYKLNRTTKLSLNFLYSLLKRQYWRFFIQNVYQSVRCSNQNIYNKIYMYKKMLFHRE